MSLAAPLAPLARATPEAWARAQLAYLDELLVEQAHLEKKAAAAAVQFLFRLPTHADVHRGLSALAREELVHFERCLRTLAQRGVAFVTLAPSPYAERLKAGVPRDLPARLAGELLVAAVIEARSHERLELLATACAEREPDLATFYAELGAAESRHAPIYADAACLVLPAAEVARLHRELIVHEAAVLRALPFAPRLHSGWAEGTHA